MKSIIMKICLFISSFVPLYFLIIVKELMEIINGNLSFNITNSVMLSLNLLFIALGILGILHHFKSAKCQHIEIIEAKNITHQNFLSYFPIFVLFALAFELEYISMATVYLLILIMIGIVYVRNEMFFINPFLNILGFKSFELLVKNQEKTEKIIRFAYGKINKGPCLAGDVFLKLSRHN